MSKFSEKLLADKIMGALRAEQPATCLELLRLMLPLSPQDKFWTYLYGDKLRQLGHFNHAQTALLQLYEEGYERLDYVAISLAQLFESRGDVEGAELWFQRATTHAPAKTGPWIWYGAFLAGSSRFREAIEVLAKGLNAIGDVDEVYLNLGLCHRAIGEYREAARCFRQALDLSKDDSVAKKALADVDSASDVVRLGKKRTGEGGKGKKRESQGRVPFRK